MRYFVLVFFGLMVSSCKKDWLEKKPEKSLVIASTIADYQSILDNTTYISGLNIGFNIHQPSMDEIGAGDFYLTDANFDGRSAMERNTYTWAKEIFTDADVSSEDWKFPYNRIFLTNLILEGIDEISPSGNNEETAWRNVKGAALFFRAYNHFSIAQLFCKPYEASTAEGDPGIPVKTKSDINIASIRSTVKDSYEQILKDLKQSMALLPVTSPDNQLYKLRPTKVAASAMLARVYLSMSLFDSAFKYSDQALNLYPNLLDYNTIQNPTTASPPKFNEEVIFSTTLRNYSVFTSSRLIVDSLLFQLYGVSDLRKTIFFRTVSGFVRFKGTYDNSTLLFSGLATDEMYLIRAECHSRKGRITESMSDLNTLLEKRWKNTSPFVPVSAADANDALIKIINERKKELCFRGLRWSDLRRLNKEPMLAVTLKRTVNGINYQLHPNDPKYVLPIPPDVIQLSGMKQNER